MNLLMSLSFQPPAVSLKIPLHPQIFWQETKNTWTDFAEKTPVC
jgi:hypothetical protein